LRSRGGDRDGDDDGAEDVDGDCGDVMMLWLTVLTMLMMMMVMMKMMMMSEDDDDYDQDDNDDDRGFGGEDVSGSAGQFHSAACAFPLSFGALRGLFP